MAWRSGPLHQDDMSTRREFSRSLAVLTGTVLLGGAGRAVSMTQAGKGWIMPDEGAPHKRTWMAFGAHKDIWGSSLLPEVQRDLALIAHSIVMRKWQLWLPIRRVWHA